VALRILFISDNYPPEVNAPARRTSEHARRWVEAGAEVCVVTCAPNFPQGRVYEGWRNRLIQRSSVDGVQVVRVWSFITANQGFVLRVLDYLSFALRAVFAGLGQEADVIVATSPQLFTTLSALALSMIKRKPWVFELRDLWPESIEAVGVLRRRWLIRQLERLELFLYRRASAIVAVTPAFKDNLVRRGVPAGKIHVVTNGADLGALRPRPKDPELVRRLGLEGAFVVAYVGTHGMAHALSFIVEAAAGLADPRVRFLFVGDGAEKEAVRARAKALGLANALFLPAVPADEAADYLSLADVALVPLKRSETFKTVIPSKIFEAAALGIPVLLGVEGQAAEIVDAYSCGLNFVPEDAEDFRAKLGMLTADAALRQRLARGGASLARDYDRAALAERMLTILKELGAAGEPGQAPR
jgi:hypothetical protein